MKPSPTVIGILSAALLATAAPGLAAPLQNEPASFNLAQVQPRDQNERRGERPARHHAGKPDQDRGNRRHDMRGDRRDRAPGTLHLAGKLAAAETYVGITAAQHDAWRAYTSALISFLDRPFPAEGRGEGPEAGRDRDPAAAAGRPGPLFAERLADRALEQGRKARTLKEAVEALRSVLDDEQIARLADAERVFAPGPGPHGGPQGGPDRRNPPHHDRDGEEHATPQDTQPPADD